MIVFKNYLFVSIRLAYQSIEVIHMCYMKKLMFKKKNKSYKTKSFNFNYHFGLSYIYRNLHVYHACNVEFLKPSHHQEFYFLAFTNFLSDQKKKKSLYLIFVYKSCINLYNFRKLTNCLLYNSLQVNEQCVNKDLFTY